LLSAEAVGRPPGSDAPVRLGVLGWPVGHSRSPAIQNAALHAVGLAGWRYQLLPVVPDLFDETVSALAQAGFRGANVTIPHKSAALALASDPSPRAQAIGAANTLLFGPDGWIGADNTDAAAVVDSLPRPARGAVALVLGAGGSARAAVWALLDAGAEVRVWNRTPERAQTLCAELGGLPVREAEPADILVNCTAVGLDGSSSLEGLPVGPAELTNYGCVVDLVYGAATTALISAARRAGVHTVDGLELLVGQGALSFELFTGVPAPRAVMRSAAGLAAMDREDPDTPTRRADP
jgi:shikimate dehydrogenase